MTGNDIDTEPSTEQLIARFHKHVQAVESNTLATKALVWHIYAAKGYHKLLAERAVTMDDDMAGDVALGAAHWVTYNDGTISAMLGQR